MNDLISRQAAIDAFDCSVGGVPAESVKYVSEYADKMMRRINALPSAQGGSEFINWLLDEIWDEELWELNYRVFPELLCRRLVRLGYLKEEGGVYVRLDKQTGNQITVCPMCPDCPDNCPLEADMRGK